MSRGLIGGAVIFTVRHNTWYVSFKTCNLGIILEGNMQAGKKQNAIIEC